MKVAPSRPMPRGHIIGKGSGPSRPSFRLCDKRMVFPELSQPRVKYAKHPPRILFFGDDSRVDSLWSAPQPAPVPAPSPGGLVNAVAPGYVVTNNTAALRADEERSAAIMSRIPAGRWGEPSDIAGAAVFLLAPASAYMHGAVIPVDGGWLAR